MTDMITYGCLRKKFKDIKGVIRTRKLKNRQHNGQQKKNKKTNTDLQKNYTEN